MRSCLHDEFVELFALVDMSDVPIVYIGKYREFGVHVLNGEGNTYQGIYQKLEYCPMIGKKLPASLRDEWFEKIWQLNLEPDDPDIPVELQNEDWWKDS
jgi:hypothetical protein